MSKNLLVLGKASCALLVFMLALQRSLPAQVAKPPVMDLVRNNVRQLGLSQQDLANLYVSDSSIDKISGAVLVYLQQEYKSIIVHNALYSVAFKDNKVVSATSRFISKMATKATGEIPSITALAAVNASASHLHLPTITAANSLSQVARSGDGKTAAFSKGNISKTTIPVKLMWVVVNDSLVKLAWEVHIDPIGTSDMWNVRVDALDGTVIEKDNWTRYCRWDKPFALPAVVGTVQKTKAAMVVKTPSARYANPLPGTPLTQNAGYLVVPYPAQSPLYPGGAQTLVTNPWLMAGASNPATTYGWHFDGVTDYAYSRGNNVFAHDDVTGYDTLETDFAGSVATSTSAFPNLSFNFPYNGSNQPGDGNNLPAAITNLFYWNNLMHDITYQYGFDEAAGNFQNDNLGRGGIGNDFVNADAQDGEGRDNANFSTPPDGGHGHMQMYLFGAPPKFTVNSPTAISGNYVAIEGAVSPFNLLGKTGPVTGNVVIYNDDSAGTVHLGCAPAVNAGGLSGNVALLYRGTCNFPAKIKDAQLAGAKAVIVVNNVAGAPIIMGGTDSSITIPAMMISLDDGNKIASALQNTAVNVSLSPSPDLDGDLDNTVITHEYTHGISSRLTGGPSNTGCLFNAEQMGEGWSDYFALMVTTDWSTAQLTDGAKSRTMGNYADGETVSGGGIRNYPYTTNMTLNPWTYGKLATLSGGEVHNIGEIWCTALWDMTWAIINKDAAINPNLYDANASGGNSVALKLVTLGMKLQPCSPGFIDGRNGILRADTILYQGKYSCAIWQAFARRGMGVGASQGNSNRYTDQVENFVVPNGATITKIANKNLIRPGDNIDYTFNVQCQCTALSNFTISDTLPGNVTYQSGGTFNGNVVSFSPINLAPQASAIYHATVVVNNGTYTPAVVHVSEPVADPAINTASWSTAVLAGTATWRDTSYRFNSAPYAFAAPDSGNKTDFVLTSVNSYLLSAVSTLSFWHYFDTEMNWDGGVVELSTNNGSTWIDAGPYMISNAYPSNIASNANSTIAGRRAFTGASGAFIQTVINLSAFAGQSVKFRFRFASDDNTGIDGWYVDDIQLKSEAGVINTGLLLNGASLVARSSAITVISADLPVTYTDFNVTKETAQALVKWQTSGEHNSQKFDVERSADGLSFQTIGTVTAAGTSTVLKNYQFTDGQPLNGTNYYRLKETDADGKATYSIIKSVVFDLTTLQVSIRPNPSSGLITVSLPASGGGTIPLQVFDGRGALVLSRLLHAGNQELNLSRLSRGTYMMHFLINTKTVIRKLVIE